MDTTPPARIQLTLVAVLLWSCHLSLAQDSCGCVLSSDAKSASCDSTTLHDAVPDCVPDDVTDLQIGLTAVSSSSFSRFPSLVRLTLRSSGLSSLPEDAFAANSQLTFLDVGINKLSSLEPGTLSSLASLHTLYLDNNQLTSLPDTLLSANPLLRTLSLDNNQLSQLSVQLLEPARGQLKQLLVSGNPLACDCHLSELLNWMDDNGVSFGRGSTTCQDSEGSNKDVYQAVSELDC